MNKAEQGLAPWAQIAFENDPKHFEGCNITEYLHSKYLSGAFQCKYDKYSITRFKRNAYPRSKKC